MIAGNKENPIYCHFPCLGLKMKKPPLPPHKLACDFTRTVNIMSNSTLSLGKVTGEIRYEDGRTSTGPSVNIF